jgi:dienelactone hydrolase
MTCSFLRMLFPVLLMLAAVAPAHAQGRLKDWSWNPAIEVTGQTVVFPSHSPFTLADVGRGAGSDPPQDATGTLFMPPSASPATPVPAVVLLHGSSGVQAARELTYGRELAAMGVAVLVVDSFAPRRDRARGFTERLLKITETMVLADAYAALRFLASRSEIDETRVALVGFSYGGMAATYAVYAQIAERLAPEGRRFVGHVAFYAPCIVRFDDSRTTGAPVLMLAGAEDEIVDRERCAEVADDLRSGGSAVETIVYPGAFHQWDGSLTGPRRIGRLLTACDLQVETDGTVRDNRTGLVMSGPFIRRLILAFCVGSEGYLIGRDDRIRARSNRDLGRFLARIFDKAGASRTE